VECVHVRKVRITAVVTVKNKILLPGNTIYYSNVSRINSADCWSIFSIKNCIITWLLLLLLLLLPTLENCPTRYDQDPYSLGLF